MITLFLTLFMPIILAAAPVISWIPPYNAEVSFQNLHADFGGYGPKDGLSHIAPQFWVPTGDGGIRYVQRSGYSLSHINDDSVKMIRDWGNDYGIKTLLCIYNGEYGWDWGLVSRSINSSNRQKFVNSLVTEMNRLGLHGVEVDLEGPNSDNPTDSENFISFIRELSDTLRALGKDLTIATFASQEWAHIPDASHWSQILPLVDGLTSMGYEETGVRASGDLSYAGQKRMASVAPEKLMLGMPDHLSQWQGDMAITQVRWARDNGVGVALWDMQLRDQAWRSAEMWKLLAEIRGPLKKIYMATATAGSGGEIYPSGQVAIDSAGSQLFRFTPDEWFVVADVRIDGVSRGALDEYLLEDVEREHTIEVIFQKDPDAPTLYTFRVESSDWGSVSPEGELFSAEGGERRFSVVPADGYVVSSVSINGRDFGPLVDLHFRGVTRDFDISATFEKPTGGDLGRYPAWSSSVTPKYREVFHHRDSLWEYTGDPHGGSWGASMEPSRSLAEVYGTPPWTFAGVYDSRPDFLQTATLLYTCGGVDTLYITTTTVTKGDTTTTEEVIYIDGTTSICGEICIEGVSPLSVNFSIGEGNLHISSFEAIDGLKLYDIRGRIVYSGQFNSSLKTLSIPVNRFTGGLYLLKIESASGGVVHRLILP